MTNKTPAERAEIIAALTPERLRQLINYDHATGNFTQGTSTPRNHRNQPNGKIGAMCNGYVAISLDGARVTAARVAFFWMNGRWPAALMDHINGDPGDNRWCNLREATRAQNMHNYRRPRNNTSGVKGVQFKRDRWYATIKVNRRVIWLGSYSTRRDAHEAYRTAAQRYFGEFARTE